MAKQPDRFKEAVPAQVAYTSDEKDPDAVVPVADNLKWTLQNIERYKAR